MQQHGAFLGACPFASKALSFSSGSQEAFKLGVGQEGSKLMTKMEGGSASTICLFSCRLVRLCVEKLQGGRHNRVLQRIWGHHGKVSKMSGNNWHLLGG